MQEVQLRDAKAQFSAVVDAAEKGEATVVDPARHAGGRGGRPSAEWQQLTGARKGFAEQLLAFPEGIELERDPRPVPRDTGL